MRAAAPLHACRLLKPTHCSWHWCHFLLSSLLSFALLTQTICMDYFIRRVDSRADETREGGGERGGRRTRRQQAAAGPCRIIVKRQSILTEQFPPSISPPHPLDLSLVLPLTRSCLMRLSCWEIGWSISLSLASLYFPASLSFHLSRPPSLFSPLTFYYCSSLFLSLSSAPFPLQPNSENYNPWIYRWMKWGGNQIIPYGQRSFPASYFFSLFLWIISHWFNWS